MAFATLPAAQLDLHAEVFSGPDAFGLVASPWEALDAASAAPPWMSHAWQRTWWECYGHGKQLRLMSLAVPSAAYPIPTWAALLPLVHQPWWGCRRLFGLGFDSQRREPLCPSHALPSVLPGLARGLAQRCDWDWLQLDSVPVATADDLAAAFHHLGLPATVSASSRQRFVPLDAPWPEITARWHRSLRSDLGRNERNLSKLGPLAFEIVSEPAAAAASFQECLRIEASGWKGRQETAMLRDTACGHFYTAIVSCLAQQCRLRLMLLRSNGALIAFGLNVLAHNVLSGLKSGIDETFRKYSPGMVLLHSTLRHAHQAGIAEFDFLGVDEDFKARWTPHARELANVRVFNRTLRGRLLAATIATRRRARSQAQLGFRAWVH